ncbi:MAG: general stress protein 26 [Saprospiraceae bacterium]|jgi:general stress protein 26
MKTLKNIQTEIWTQLIQGENDRKHPFRCGVLGTVSENISNLRTVVIRKVIQEENELWFYTDFRSPKVQEIQNNNNITWLFYHSNEQLQLRLYGNAEIIQNTSINQEIWLNLPDYGKSDYLTQHPPGSTLSENDKESLNKDFYQNFCIIKTKIKVIDYLRLNRDGHLRAKFEIENNEWKGEWLVP